MPNQPNQEIDGSWKTYYPLPEFHKENTICCNLFKCKICKEKIRQAIVEYHQNRLIQKKLEQDDHYVNWVPTKEEIEEMYSAEKEK